MHKITIILFSAILFLNGCTIIGEEQFPTKEIKDIKAVELKPTDSIAFEDYVKKDLENINGYDWWSTLHFKKLTKFTLTTSASSTLNNSDLYKSANLCDGKAETAWVEGVKGNGIGEWIKIAIDAYSSFSEVTTTPFSIFEIAILPGYAKSQKTWVENNRVKKLQVIIHSPSPSYPKENEWIAFQLDLKDKNDLQVFKIPNDKTPVNFDPMKHEIWLRIMDVYKGTKYDDTCISEFVAVGGFTN